MSALIKKDSLIFIIVVIRFYQYLLAPLWTSKCRFYPTCSNYSIQALQEKGFAKGIWLTVTRILRCNPVFPGGYDPVR
ncbi:MAG: membrane protein insertion efficiency factor YidD [Candidatus Kaelpia aquatica]|nr:membrane protein insertion efficiency factor YidD [Candidatus Kaelpia aquatica]